MIYNASRYNEKAFQACATTNISIAGALILLEWRLYITNGIKCVVQHSQLSVQRSDKLSPPLPDCVHLSTASLMPRLNLPQLLLCDLI